MFAPQGSSLLSQSRYKQLQWLRVFRLQQGVLVAEEREVCKHCVKVWVQTQRKCFIVVRPVNVSQSPKQKQKDLLDEE